MTAATTRVTAAPTRRRRDRDRPATRAVATADGATHAVPTDPPGPALIGAYGAGEGRRDVGVEPAGDGGWTVVDRPAGPGGEAVEVEALPRWVEDPLGEAVSLAVDYLATRGLGDR